MSQTDDDDDRLTLLLVEDSTEDVFLVAQAMQEEGIPFRLNVLDDGEKAISFLDEIDREDGAESAPGVILLDLNLPRKTGDEVLRRVRLSPKCSKTPVIVMTSSNDAADRSRMMELGADEYFRKPSDLDEFMQIAKVIKRIAEQRGLSRAE